VSTLDPALPLIAVISSRLHAEGPGERHPARDPIEFGLPAADERGVSGSSPESRPVGVQVSAERVSGTRSSCGVQTDES